MCLIAVAWKCHPRYRLVLIANRDEFHARPAQPAAEGPSQIYGGRDVRKGGSWLLASGSGRLAAVTNVRAGRSLETAPRSRGELTDEFVNSNLSPVEHLGRLSARAPEYGRFNLLLASGDELHYASNHPQFRHCLLEPGLHALSNGDLDAPWPKAEHARRSLSAWLNSETSHVEPTDVDPLFAALADRAPASDNAWPDTGVGIELERFLSAPFIVGADYGTRASTVVLFDAAQATFHERSFGPGGIDLGESLLRFACSKAAQT